MYENFKNTPGPPPSKHEPYQIVGTGSLVSYLWQQGGSDSGWSYRFNMFRMCTDKGHVSQMYRPEDLFSLARLCGLVAFKLAFNSHLRHAQQVALTDLAHKLHDITFTPE